jgi:hypothetical protein
MPLSTEILVYVSPGDAPDAGIPVNELEKQVRVSQ